VTKKSAAGGRLRREAGRAQVVCPDGDCFVLMRPDGSWHFFDEPYDERLGAAYEEHSFELRAPIVPALPAPRVSMIVFVSEACNLRCDYCKVAAMVGAPEKTPTDAGAIIRSIREVATATLGRVDVIFYGGEPLLEFGAIDAICTELKSVSSLSRIAFSATTNGTLLNDRILDVLLRHSICVGVSIDGNPRTHDAHRVNLNGRATHSRVIDNYRALKRAGVECGPISVVTDASRLVEVFDYFVTEFDDSTVHLKPLEVRGTEDPAWLAEYFEAFVNGQLELLTRCIDEDAQGLRRRTENRTLGAVRGVLRSTEPSVRSCRTSGRDGCSIGQEILGIEADGERIPCPNVKKFVRRDTAWMHMIETRGGYCDGCRYKAVCPSFCMAEMDEAYLERFAREHDTRPIDVLCAANRRLVDGIFRLYRRNPAAMVRYAALDREGW
jgi:sulfatase maturation enzyme AslB (radical SAM superfamily)